MKKHLLALIIFGFLTVSYGLVNYIDNGGFEDLADTGSLYWYYGNWHTTSAYTYRNWQDVKSYLFNPEDYKEWIALGRYSGENTVMEVPAYSNDASVGSLLNSISICDVWDSNDSTTCHIMNSQNSVDLTTLHSGYPRYHTGKRAFYVFDGSYLNNYVQDNRTFASLWFKVPTHSKISFWYRTGGLTTPNGYRFPSENQTPYFIYMEMYEPDEQGRCLIDDERSLYNFEWDSQTNDYVSVDNLKINESTDSWK